MSNHLEWKMTSTKASLFNFGNLKIVLKTGRQCHAYRKREEIEKCNRQSAVMVMHPHNAKIFCADCYRSNMEGHPSYKPIDELES